MNDDRQPGLFLIAAGLLFGVLGDSVLRSLPWGLGATFLVMALVGVVVALQLRYDTPAGTGRVLYSGIALALSVGFAWRDAAVLKLLDMLALVMTLGLLGSERKGLEGGRSLGGIGLRVCGTAAYTWLSPPLLVLHDVDWSRLDTGHLLRRAFGVARGIVVAFPVLLVFTALLATADPVFALRLGEVLDLDVLATIGHIAGVLVFGWIAAGYLRAAVLRERPAHLFPERPAALALGRIEIGLVLGLVDLLFSAFVWIQMRYLFGGTEWVQRVAGLTYAEYARRGFFELVVVAALVLVLLLIAHWLSRPDGGADQGMFAVLAGVQVLLVLVMLVSAQERMRLYRAEYGLTELRFYTTAFMYWLGALLVWFLLTVPRGRRTAFAGGVLASALATLLLLHLADPDDAIVRANASLARPFDVRYALTLGADAVPALLEALPSLDPGRRAAVAAGLLKRWGRASEADWRTFCRARARARSGVSEAEPALRDMAEAAAPGLVTP